LDPPLDQLVKVSFRTVLHDDEDTVSVAEVLVELDNSWTFEHFEERNFSMRRLLLLAIHVIQIYLLQGVLFVVNDIVVEGDLSCGALAERAQFFVLRQTSQLVGLRYFLRLSSMLHLLCQSSTLLHPNRLDQIIGRAKF